MNLIHCSSSDFVLVPLKKFPQHREKLKPNGLWCSLEDEDPNFVCSWLRWCRDVGIFKHTHFYRLRLEEEENILFLNSKKEYLLFKEKYNFDWDKVSTDYKGVYFDTSKMDDCRDTFILSLDGGGFVFFDTTILSQVGEGTPIDFSLGVYDE